MLPFMLIHRGEEFMIIPAPYEDDDWHECVRTSARLGWKPYIGKTEDIPEHIVRMIDVMEREFCWLVCYE